MTNEQNLKKCPFCANDIAISAKKCRFCGKWLETKEKECPYCLQKIPLEARKCLHCGSYVEQKKSLLVKVGYYIFYILAFIVSLITMSVNPEMDAMGMILILLLAGALYLLPTCIADNRYHKKTNIIFMLNLFLGWLIFVWIGLLIWAFIDD